MVIEFWHWIVLGIALSVLEIFLPSFTILWFGLGALLVAVVMLLWPQLPLYAQLALWAVATVAMSVAWFRYFKPRLLDRTGMVVYEGLHTYGGMAGREIYESSQRNRREASVTVCDPVREDAYRSEGDGEVAGYDVTYRYGGREYTTRTDHHPHYYWEEDGRLTDAPNRAVVLAGTPLVPEGAELSRIDVVIRLRRRAR